MKKEILKVKVKKALPFLVVQMLMPLLSMVLISNSGISGGEMITFLVVFPFFTTCIACLYGGKKFFFWGYPVLVGLSFLPTVVCFLNYTALFYVVWYGGFALIGMTLGFWWKKAFQLLKTASLKEKLG